VEQIERESLTGIIEQWTIESAADDVDEEEEDLDDD
jgi:hypothetical protein